MAKLYNSDTTAFYQKCERLQWIVIQLAKSHSQKRKIMAQNEFVYSGTDSEERKWKE